MANKILTPKTLWDKFNDQLPLNETTLSSDTISGAVYNYVYFSGRNVGTSRVRIYGVYAKQKNSKSDTIVILPDVSETVDVDLVTHFAGLGFNVLMVDLRGKTENASDYTVYPDKVYYANYVNSSDTFNYVEQSAKETCWYEWCAVAKYAVSYAKNKSPNSKIGVLGINQGANVAWQLSATDKRVDASAFISGAGWLAYKSIYKHSGEELELDDERCRFIAGIDAHAYAQHVKCPVFLLGCTNSNKFDVDRAVDTLQRVNNENKCWFNFSNNSKDVLDKNSLVDVELFFNKFLKNAKIKFPSLPKIKIDCDDEDFYYEVECDIISEVESVSVFSSSNDLNPAERVWFNLPLYKYTEDGKYIFKRRIYGKVDIEIAYAVVKYKSGLTLSSKFDAQLFNVYSNSKIPSVIFSSSRLNSSFLVENVKTQVLGGVFSVENLYNYVKGPCDIYGVSTKNTLLTYSIKKFSEFLSENSFIKFDAYTEVPDTVTIKISCHDGFEYLSQVVVDGSENWQNLTISFKEFKTSIGMPIKNYDQIYCLTVSSFGSVLVNNFLVL